MTVMTQFHILDGIIPSIRPGSKAVALEKAKNKLEELIFSQSEGSWKKAFNLISDPFHVLGEPEKIAYREHFADLITKNTALLLGNYSNVDPDQPKSIFVFTDWLEFVRWMTVSSEPLSPHHTSGIKNILDILDATDNLFLLCEPIRMYRKADEAVVDHIFELCMDRNIDRNEDLAVWVINTHAPNSGLKENIWTARFECMVKEMCASKDWNNFGDIVNQIWKMVSDCAKEGVFADTDWPLRITRSLHDSDMKDLSLKMDFNEIIAIRNACPGGVETDRWFMAAALRMSMMVERAELRSSTESDGAFSKVINLTSENNRYATHELRKFHPFKTPMNQQPLWEIALKQLGAGDEIVNSIKMAQITMSVDFTQKENFCLAMMIMENDGRDFNAQPALDLTSMVDKYMDTP